jgi:hypothetical protein
VRLLPLAGLELLSSLPSPEVSLVEEEEALARTQEPRPEASDLLQAEDSLEHLRLALARRQVSVPRPSAFLAATVSEVYDSVVRPHPVADLHLFMSLSCCTW